MTKPHQIRACPNCGSTNISAGRLGSGVLYGVTSWLEECRDCGYKGYPLLFDSEEEYHHFLQDLKQKKPSETTGGSREDQQIMESSEEAFQSFSSKEQEVLTYLKEDDVHSGKTDAVQREIKEKKEWWVEIVIALIGSAVIVTFVYVPLYRTFLDQAILVIYCILLFVLLTFALLFSVVVVEYFAQRVYVVLKRR